MTQNIPSSAPEQQQPKEVLPSEIMQLGPESVNNKQFEGMNNNPRRIARHGNKLIIEATLYCGRLVNMWFKYVTNHPDDIEGQKTELIRLDKVWKDYLRARSDKYIYLNSAYLFLKKMQFLIGDKKANEEMMEKIKTEK